MKTICLVSGGPEYLLPDRLELDDAFFIGVDEGVLYLQRRDIEPIAAFGDFDSISSEEVARLQEKRMNLYTFEREKDMTDLELAIRWAIEKRPEKIILYGATGGRLDHEIINIQLLKLGIEQKIEVEVVDRDNIIVMRSPGSYTIEAIHEFPYVSFIPFSPLVSGVTLVGFRYPLEDAMIEWGSTLCISNELVTKKGTYSFDSGIIMMIRSKDRDQKLQTPGTISK
ncbi:thiamine diphosphokinase [Pseudalkalibacillus salsuginis]|uniref:thiamine diphosphokinase n=1 Tax=Pseudalkalibacillus salsuginis TaxID=2910972 RepID=UPI001F1C01AC|nr:thiamine diphosphokinase [Pseudalkalibacillus salsuginis]MCF6410522.1 thiamine diphosphokinase [Pseudalkalibacillus salsuginis]